MKLKLLTIALALVGIASAQAPPSCTKYPMQQQPYPGLNSTVNHLFTPAYSTSTASGLQGVCGPITIPYFPYIQPPPYSQAQIALRFTSRCTPGIFANSQATYQSDGQSVFQLADDGTANRYQDNVVLHFSFETADCGCYPYGYFWEDVDYGC